MCDKDFINKGYKEYKPSSIDNESVVKCFQKRFDDDIGKKYFINVKKWDWTKYNILPQDYTYEFNIQLYSKEKHNPINLEFFGGWDIDDVEKHMKTIWNNDTYDYYEK